MSVRVTEWDPSEYLDNEETMSVYINEALKDGDPKLIAAAIGDIARSVGMSHIAKQAKVSREALYRALSDKGNPEFATVLAALQALNLTLQVAPKEPAAEQPVAKAASADLSKHVEHFRRASAAGEAFQSVKIKSGDRLYYTTDIKLTGMRHGKRPHLGPTGPICRAGIRPEIRSTGPAPVGPSLQYASGHARDASHFDRLVSDHE